MVVNATSLGLHAGEPPPVDPAALEPATAYVDIIAAVDVTEMMRAAAERGCRVMGGRPMVDRQMAAQIAFLGAPKLGGGA